MLETTEYSFDDVALAIYLFVEPASMSFITSTRYGVPYPMLAAEPTNAPGTVSFVGDHAIWAQSWTTAAWTLDGALCHELLEHRRFVLLAGRQDNRDGVSLPVDPYVDLGAKPTTAAA